MSLLYARKKLVTFRVSDDEYSLLSRVSLQTGTRSISEFARSAVLERVKVQGSRKGFLVQDLSTIAMELEDLDGCLKDLSGRIERLLGPVDLKAHQAKAGSAE